MPVARSARYLLARCRHEGPGVALVVLHVEVCRAQEVPAPALAAVLAFMETLQHFSLTHRRTSPGRRQRSGTQREGQGSGGSGGSYCSKSWSYSSLLVGDPWAFGGESVQSPGKRRRAWRRKIHLRFWTTGAAHHQGGTRSAPVP